MKSLPFYSDDCLQKTSIVTDKHSDTMLILNSESNPSIISSQVEVEGSGKKKKTKRKRKKRGVDPESNEVQPNLLYDNSTNITPAGNDATLQSCVDVSSLTESEKISSHVALASENVSLKIDSVMTECGAEFCPENEKENEKPNNNTGGYCLQKTSIVMDKPSDTVPINSGSDSTKTASHVEVLKKKRKKNKKRKKRSTDLNSDEVRPACSDGNSFRIASVERDPSVDSCVDISSLVDSEKISGNVKLTPLQKKKRKKKRKSGNNDVKADVIEPNCLDIDEKKTTPPIKDASSDICVDSEKLISHVGLASPQRRKRKKRRKNGNNLHQGNDKVCEGSESTCKDISLHNDRCLLKLELEEPDITGTGGKDNQSTENSASCLNCGPASRGTLKSQETNKKVEETNSLSASLTKDDPNLNVMKEENHLQLLSTLPTDTKVVCDKKKLLILDLNGLLVDIVANPPKDCIRDKTVANKAVFKRPFCDDFLQFCFERFSVGVWSSRTKRNVDTVIDCVMGKYKHKLLFSWGQPYCTKTGFMTVDNKHKPLVLKELRKLWDKTDPNLPWMKGEYNESNTLLIDDSPYKALRNPSNTAIFPYPYQFSNSEDRALGPGGDLRVYLEGLASADNIQRYVEQNPFGQQAIDERDSNWEFYTRVMGTN